MSTPRLTVGMACYNDFDGVYFTIQALRLYHPSHEVEIVVVDQGNNPSHSEMVKGVCANAGAKYVSMPTPTGTSPSRNRVFAEASGEFVLCIDSHVLLAPDAVQELLSFITYESRTPENRWNLYQGPMLQDNLKSHCTHFNYEWRSEMLGTWGRAMRCRCGHSTFSCLQVNDQVVFISLTNQIQQHFCPSCGNHYYPNDGYRLPWPGHEAKLEALGHYTLGLNTNDEPFEIPGQGLGLFGCRKEAWLGFNEHANGFGAEEMCVHELYRQKGHKTICLSFLQWVHRFGRANGVPYPLQRYHKVRNYVLWFNQLEKPLDEIEQHFVAAHLLPKDQWDYLVANPVNNVSPPAAPCGSCGQQPAPSHITNVDQAFDFVEKTLRDFNEHMATLRQYASQCDHVTEFSIRRESAIALVASGAKVTSYNAEKGDSILIALKAFAGEKFTSEADPLRVGGILPTDLLFLNDTHTAERVSWQLETFALQVSHYIILHNTQIFGEVGEDGQPGILHAARQFMRKNPQWSVIHHDIKQYGLTILSCKPEDKKQLPGLATKILNFAVAMKDHVADGLVKVEPVELENRLNICAGCPQRNVETCGACGCPLKEKAPLRSADCPLGYWPEVARA